MELSERVAGCDSPVAMFVAEYHSPQTMTITVHSSTKTLAILDLAVALLYVNFSASLLANDTPANISHFLMAVLIPTGLLRWKTQLSNFQSLPIWQKLFALFSVLALSAVWIYALLMSAGSLMRLGSPDSNFIMLN